MIGVFDSGIGGVTVLKEIIKELPYYHYVYYSDSINNPYGDKSVEELNQITKEIVNSLIAMGCKVIVIACNTASAICKDTLRSSFSIPIIAIEPAIKMVNDFNPHGSTLVMATKGTMESEKFLELYHKCDIKHITLLPCSGLADLIEKGEADEIRAYLKEHLTKKDFQNVVLGCTHYPLIKEEIKEILGDVTFYDGSKGVTKRLKEIVDEISLPKKEFKINFIDSSKSKQKEKRFYNILEK